MNVSIVCGGTGGHLFPGMAVGEELLARNHQVLLVISKKEIDQKAVQGSQGFLIQTLPAVGWRGWRPDHMLRFAAMMCQAMVHTRRIFRDFQPDAVVGMGGFSSVAPLLLARMHKIPSCIHESNAIAGKANRLAARFVSAVAVGFETTRDQFAGYRTIWTGTPVRSVLRVKKDCYQARKELALSEHVSTVLVIGGSQGARGLNRLVMDALSHFGAMDIQWLHLTGVEDESSVREAYARLGKTAKVYGFYREMARLYAAADMVIARSGAASLAEIARWSLPCILIPFPLATDHHQWANASLFAEKGSAVVQEESECSTKHLAGEIKDILMNQERRKKMAEAAKAEYVEDSHKKLADLVEELAM